GDDGVVLILAIDRVALGAAFLETDHLFVAVVPASRTLAEIAADRSEVANLRCPDAVRRFRQRAIALSDSGILDDVGQLYQRSDLEALAVGFDRREAGHGLEIDDHVR